MKSPIDKQFIRFIKEAYTHKIHCCYALIAKTGLKLFDPNYLPTVSEEYKTYFTTKQDQTCLPPLFTYQDSSGYFIVSDDYFNFYLQKSRKYNNLVCLNLGVIADSPYVIARGDPFYLEPPTYKVI